MRCSVCPVKASAAPAASSRHRSDDGRSALLLATIWWPVALALAITYFAFVTQRYAGK